MKRQSLLPSNDYQLVWSDEFEGNKIDSTKWGYRCLGPRGDAYVVKDSCILDGKGHLVISTKRNGKEIETGMLATEGKFETTFGYFEARMKFQTEPGHWSAFWLQSSNMAKVGNTKKYGTEIDIIEFFSTDRKSMFMNIHWDGYGDEHKKASSKYKDPSLADGWHVVGLEWTAEYYRFFLNGKEVWRTTEAISHAQQFIIFSLEVRKWVGDIDIAKLPDSLLVDYIRVFDKDY